MQKVPKHDLDRVSVGTAWLWLTHCFRPRIRRILGQLARFCLEAPELPDLAAVVEGDVDADAEEDGRARHEQQGCVVARRILFRLLLTARSLKS